MPIVSVTAPVPQSRYDIHIGRGLLSRCADLFAPYKGRRAAVVLSRRIRRAIVSTVAVSQTTTPRSRKIRRFSSRNGTPPPVAKTSGRGSLANSATTAASQSRNAGSPSCAKMSAIRFPARASTTSSVSTQSNPQRSAKRAAKVDFPVARYPTRTIFVFIFNFQLLKSR